MKTKALLVALSVICFATASRAQQKFNVQNGTKTEFYDDLETAIQKAVSGDTIYLPGKIIQVQNDVIIDKKLAIIGAGCDVDSVGGLQTTEIKKSDGFLAMMNFRNGSDGSLLMGCIVGDIQFGHNNEYNEPQQNIQNVTIFRNKIGSINLAVAVSNDQVVKNIFIKENQIGGFINGFGIGATDCWITNNLVYAIGYGTSNLNFYNNVISGFINSAIDCRFENNFINSFLISGSFDNCIFNNNAFATSFTFPFGNNSGSNNLMDQTPQQTFGVDDLSLPKNLKILATSPCKNAGTDGTDIGIFGGPAPYKAGAVPFNPHITRSSIVGYTDKDGKLKVNIQVSAQTR